MNEKQNKMIELLVDILGKFKKFDEERVANTSRVKNHEDRLEKLEKVLFKS